jgi:esterase FrsA
MKNNIAISALSVAPDITLYHTGPCLDFGPLPSLFYLALSGPDSLTLDPYNQPIQFLRGKMIRIFSLTLPGHENGLAAKDALKVWAEDLFYGRNCIENFLDQAEQAVAFAIRERFIAPDKMAIAGLSRGGLFAFHLASRLEQFRFILAFAPITKLNKAKEFEALQEHPVVKNLDAEALTENLCDRHIRFYIGNDDTRVGTHSCFDFAMSLVAMAHRKKIRPPQVELFITPSIGHMGHGTSPEIFSQGAHWIADVLK